MFDIRKEAVLILIGLAGFYGVQWLLRYIKIKKGLNYKWPSPQPIKKTTIKPQQKCIYCGNVYDYDLNSCPSCNAGIVWQEGDYCIACNIGKSQKYLKRNTKVWIIGGWSGGAYERVKIVCHSRGGRLIEKWIAIKHLTNFRACFIPPFLKGFNIVHTGTKEYMKFQAKSFEQRKDYYIKNINLATEFTEKRMYYENEGRN